MGIINGSLDEMKRVNELGYGWVMPDQRRDKYHWLEQGHPVCDSSKNYPALQGRVLVKNEILYYSCARCLSESRSYLRTIKGQVERLRLLLRRTDVLY